MGGCFEITTWATPENVWPGPDGDSGIFSRSFSAWVTPASSAATW